MITLFETFDVKFVLHLSIVCRFLFGLLVCYQAKISLEFLVCNIFKRSIKESMSVSIAGDIIIIESDLHIEEEIFKK